MNYTRRQLITGFTTALQRPLLFTAVSAVVALLHCATAVAQDFTISTLTASNAVVVEVATIVGDDRGGIAVSSSQAFLTGDGATARFNANTLGGGVTVGSVRDGLVSDLATRTVYLLGNGSTPLPYGGGTLNSLIEVDGATGLPNGRVITLNVPISLTGSGAVGIFSGWGCIVLHNGFRAYRVSLPAGTVTDLGAMAVPARTPTESWAYWGVAETLGTQTRIVYVANSTTIARTVVPSGPTTPVATFSNLGDMASITVSVEQNRWYFHSEGGSQFGAFSESLGYASATFVATAVAPTIVVQPTALALIQGETAAFSVTANGTGPLTYQWRKDGTSIVGATNSTYTIATTVPGDVGNYSVVVANAAGSVTSSPAALTISAIDADLFKITRITTNNLALVDSGTISGDDRGGLITTDQKVFLRGDEAVGSYNFNLTGGTQLLNTQVTPTEKLAHDALVSDLRAQKAYVLAAGTTPLGVNGGTATALRELNPTNGLPTGATVTLSTSIVMPGTGIYNAIVGIFSGWGRIVIHNGTRAYSINTANGTVTDLGAMARPTRVDSESWAYWGAAEYFGGHHYMVYVRDAQSIVRTRIPDGATTVISSFANLGDMASFTVKPSLNRWFFHTETFNQFNTSIALGTEILGGADAAFLYQPVGGVTLATNTIAVLEDSGLRSNSNFVATSPATTASYNVTTANAALFSVQPAVALDGTLTFTPAADAHGSAAVTVVALDATSLPVGSGTFTITVASLNDAPSFTLAASASPITVIEDSGVYSLTNGVTNISPGPANESAQLVTLTLTNNNNALFAVQPTLGTNGTLTFTPVANAAGTATVTVLAQDNGGTANGGVDTSAAQTFTVTVTSVNDAPTIAIATNNVVVPVNGGARTQASFISSFTPGPADEAAQTVLGYTVSNDNAALFTVAPAIAANGTLTFTLAANVVGTATVTVRAQDSGGTANGGVDLSVAQTFSVTVVGVNDAPSFDLTVGATAPTTSVAAWGSNAQFQTNVPAGLSGVIAVAASGYHSLALKGDGTVAAWGYNHEGQATVPAGLGGVVAIAAGGYHSLALRSDGTVVAWGRNNSGQTAVPAGLSGVSAIAAGDDHSLALKSDGTVVAWGMNWAGQGATPSGLVEVRAIAAGGHHNLALKNDGSVMAWGYNYWGQASVPAGLSGVAAVAAGHEFSLALKSDGTVVAWGRNDEGQTSVPAGLSGVSALDGGWNHALALRSNGTVVVWGLNNYGQANIPAGLSGVTAITAGWEHNMALTGPIAGASGITVSEDSGAYSQLNVATNISPGPVDEASQTVSFLVSNDNAALFSVAPALATNGTLTFTPAANAFGTATVTVRAQDTGGTALGGVDTSAAQTFTLTVNAVNDAPSFVVNAGLLGSGGGSETNVIGWGQQVVFSQGPLDAHFTSLAAGLEHNLALRSDGTVVAWGYHSAATVPTGLSGVRAIAAGDQHSLALQSNGVVVAWGNNSFGETSVPAGLSGVTAVAAGDNYSLALKSDGTVVAWGNNGSGQTTVPVGLSGVTAIAAGHTHSLALKNDGTVVAWGENGHDQATIPAGLSGVTALAAGVRHSLALKSDGTVVVWGDGRMTIPAGLSGVTAIAAGQYHCMALKSDGTVVAWGVDTHGQVIVPTGLSGVMAIAGGGFHSLALKTDGTVVAWGDVGYTPTPVSPGLSGVKAIAAGNHHTLALKNDGTVVVPWALQNHNGAATVPAGLIGVTAIATRLSHNLALKSDGTVVAWGDESDGKTTVPVGLSGVTAVAAGAFHSLALKSDGTVVAWGAVFPVPTGLNGVSAIAAGAGHNLALKSDGTVVAWGYDAFGQATVPEGLSGVVAIAAGAYHSLALKNDGTVVAWGGHNNSGAESVPVGLSGVTAIAGGWAYSLALKSDGTVVAWGANVEGEAVVPVGLNGVVAIAAGTSHSLALRATGGTGVATPLTVSEDSGPQTIASLATGISAGPANESAQTVSFLVTNDNAALFSAWPVVAANGTLTFTPAANAAGTATVTVRAQDSGGTANGGVDTSAAQTFTVTVTGVNDAPSFTLASTNRFANSLLGAQTVAAFATGISAGPADEAGQTVSFQLSNTATSLFTVQPALAANGTLTFTPVAGALGTATVTVIAVDTGGTTGGGVDRSTNTFTLTLAPGNVAPSFTLASTNVTVLEDATAQTVTNFVTSASPGPAHESSQTVSVAVLTNSNPALFSAQPALAANGTLTFTPAANANGTATVTVVAQDNGGTADGGVDRSTNTFTLTVTAVNDAPSFAVNTGLLSGSGGGLQTNVVAWGSDGYGQATVPADLSGVTAIAGGAYHSLALKSNGTAVAWGYNNYGQATVPAGLNGVTAVAAGFQNSLVLKSDGTVVAWGNNDLGQATVPAGLNGVIAIAVGGDHSSHSLALKNDGTVVAWGYNVSGQTTVPAGLNGVVAIAAGGSHSLALKSDGTVVAWGANSDGQTTVPAGLNGVVAIAAGAYHSLALKSDGTVVAWNTNLLVRHIVPDGLNGVTAIAAGYHHNLALKSDGTVVAWGDSGYGQATVPAGLNGATAITAGYNHSLALFTTGSAAPANTLAVLEDSGSQTVVNFATNLFAGPPDESAQLVTFTVTNNNNALFSAQPALGTNGTLTFTPATNAFGTATVTVIAQDNGGTANGGLDTSAAQTFTITVSAGTNPPVIAQQPSGLTLVLGGAGLMQVGAEGGSPLVYQWLRNGVAVGGATNSSLAFTNVQAAQAGVYSVVITNAFGSATSSGATLTLLLPPTITATPVSQSALIGGTLSLSVTATGSPTLTYQWRVNGTAIPGATSSTLTLANVQPTTAGSYTVVVTNPYGTVTSAVAQVSAHVTPIEQWQRSFGGTGSDQLLDIVPLAAGGYLLSGKSDSGISGNKTVGTYGGQDFYLVRVDTNGIRLWETNYGGTADDIANGVVATSDGGFVVAGSTRSAAGGNKASALSGIADMWAVKFNASGVKQWDFGIGGAGASAYNEANDVAETADGGYLLVGYSTEGVSGTKTSPKNGGYADAWVVKVNASGVKQWEANFGGTADESFYTVLATPDGGALLGGRSISSAGGNKSAIHYGGHDFWLVKIDANGIKQWDQTYGGSTDESLRKIVPTADGGYLLTGESDSVASGGKSSAKHGDFDYWVVKVNVQGEKQWDRTFGGDSYDELRHAYQTSDGRFVLTGRSRSTQNTGNKTAPHYAAGSGDDYWVVCIDAVGNIVWQETYGGSVFQDAFASVPTPDGGILVGGYSASPISGTRTATAYGNDDFWLVKLTGDSPFPAVFTQPATTVAVSGGNTTISVLASGASLSYQWRRNGVNLVNGGNISGATSATLTFTGLTEADVAHYDVVIGNSFGTVTSSMAQVALRGLANITTGLVAHYSADGHAQGSIGGNHGAVSNGAAFATGFAGQAFSFDGVDDFVEVPHSAAISFDFANPFSYAFWLKTTTTTDGKLFIKGSTGNPSFLVELSASGGLSVQLRGSGGGGLENGPPNLGLNNGQWHHVVIAYDGTASDAAIKIYVDGAQTANNYGGGSTSGTMANTAPLQIGRWSGSPNLPFAGQMDDLRIYNRVITSSEAAQFYNSLLTPSAPSITTQPLNVAALAGANATFTVGATGGALTYQWRFNGTNLAGATNASLTLVSVTSTQAGNYDAILANSFGSVTSSVAVLTLVSPPEITAQLVGVAIAIGSNATFSVTATGSAPLVYQWFRNGVAVGGATNSSLAFTNAQVASAGNYFVTVTNTYGAVTSAVARLTVGSALNDDLVAWYPLDGDLLDYSGNARHGTATNFTPSYLTGPVGQALKFAGNAQNRVDLQTWVPGTNSFTFSGWVKYDSTNEFAFWPFDPVVTLFNSGSGDWSHGFAVSLNIRTNGIVPSFGAVSAQGTSVVFRGTNHAAAGVWHHLVGVMDRAAGQMRVYWNGALVSTGNVSTLGPINSVWSHLGGFHNGTSHNAAHAARQDDVRIYSRALTPAEIQTLGSALHLTVQPVSQAVYTGQNATFTVGALGTAPLAYQWRKAGANLPAGTNATLQLSAVTSSDVGNYDVVVSDTTGSVTSSVVALTVLLPNTAPSFTLAATNVAALEDAGAQTHAAFLTNLSPGPTNEAAQTVTVTATNSQPTLFASQPTISANGTLTFTSAAHANGTATVTVVAQDNGGTGGGGVDRATNTFTITVTAVNDAPGVAISSGLLAGVGVLTNVTAWGNGAVGQTSVPIGLTNAVTIAGGGDRSLAIRRDGTLVGWGDNTYGQNTIPAGLTQAVAIALGTHHSLAVKPDGSVVAWGHSPNGEVAVPGALSGATAVAAGHAHSVALKADGTVIAWGDNTHGQLNIPGATTDVSAIAAAGFHNLALRSNGTVVAWGMNAFGQTSVPGGLTNVVSIAAGGEHSLALRADGTVVAWGRNTEGQSTIPGGLSNVIAVAAGALHSMALLADGTVIAWGHNTVGQVTVPSGLARATAIAAGGYHSMALLRSSNIVLAEDAGAQSIPAALVDITAGPTDEAGQVVSFVVTNNNSALFSTQPAIGTNGTLTFTPVANANGSATVTVLAQDDGGTANGGVDTSAVQTFTITVNAVNDAPSFTKGADQVAFSDDGTVAVAGWATGISAGPADEAGQSVSFVVTNSAGGLFTVAPAVSASGGLTFTPAPGASGVVTVGVRAVDSGGTANGGVDTSAVQTFTVSLAARKVYLAASPTAGAGDSVTVPVSLRGTGAENGAAFTLTYPASLLTFTGATVGGNSAAASVLANGNTAGQLGLLVTLPLGQVWAAGSNEIALLTFMVAAGAAGTNAALAFGDAVVARQVSDVNAVELAPVKFVGGSVSIATPSVYEGDVSPRPTGNGTVTVTDAIQISRFAAGLDTVTNFGVGGEFQRADVAPRGSLGDGRITVTDAIQAQRYAAGLDPLTAVGGPVAPSAMAPASLARTSAAGRAVRIASGNLIAGRANSVTVQVEALGNEAGMSFSLAFDPAALTFVSAATGVSGGTLMVNGTRAATGRVGLVLMLPAGTTLAAGVRDVVTLTFNVTGTGATSINLLGDSPVAREVADVNANVLGASFVGANFNIVLPAGLQAAGVERAANGSLRLVIRNADGSPVTAVQAARYAVHVTSNLGGAWTLLPNALVLENGALKIADPAASGAGLRLYKLVETP